jgi:hypothetical protein
MKRNKSIPIINHEAFELSNLDIQQEVTGYADQIEYESEVVREYHSLLTQIRNNNYTEKQRLNSMFPNVYHLRITNPGIFDKSKWLTQIALKGGR